MRPAACPTCLARPSGIEGHRTLTLDEYPKPGHTDPNPVFRCTQCGSLWSRRYVGEGLFIWHAERVSEPG